MVNVDKGCRGGGVCDADVARGDGRFSVERVGAMVGGSKRLDLFGNGIMRWTSQLRRMKSR